MKKLIILGILLLGIPAFAKVIVKDDNGGWIDLPEEDVESVETIKDPSYGVRVNLKNGRSYELYMETRGRAALQLIYAYEALQKYYGWDDAYTYKMFQKQDKANLGIH